MLTNFKQKKTNGYDFNVTNIEGKPPPIITVSIYYLNVPRTVNNISVEYF